MADKTQEAGSAKVYRVQFDFSQESYDKLSEIMKLAGVQQKADVVRYALAIYKFLLEAQRDGKTPAIISGEGESLEVHTFPLEF